MTRGRGVEGGRGVWGVVFKNSEFRFFGFRYFEYMCFECHPCVNRLSAPLPPEQLLENKKLDLKNGYFTIIMVKQCSEIVL